MIGCLQMMLDTCKDPSQLASLHSVFTGGEVLNPATLALAQRLVPQVNVLNVYGPTEVCCCPPPPASDHFSRLLVRVSLPAVETSRCQALSRALQSTVFVTAYLCGGFKVSARSFVPIGRCVCRAFATGKCTSAVCPAPARLPSHECQHA